MAGARPAPLGARSWQLGRARSAGPAGTGPGPQAQGEARRSARVAWRGGPEAGDWTRWALCLGDRAASCVECLGQGPVPLAKGGCWEACGRSGCQPWLAVLPGARGGRVEKGSACGLPARQARPTLLPCTPVALAVRPSPAGRLPWEADLVRRGREALGGARCSRAAGSWAARRRALRPSVVSIAPEAPRLAGPALPLASCLLCVCRGWLSRHGATRGWTRWGVVGWEPGCGVGDPARSGDAPVPALRGGLVVTRGAEGTGGQGSAGASCSLVAADRAPRPGEQGGCGGHG